MRLSDEVDEDFAAALLVELQWRAKSNEITTYQPLLRAQRRACLALKRLLEEEHAIYDPRPEKVHTWLRENELGLCFRVEYQLHPTVKIVNGVTTGTAHAVSICLDYQLRLTDLLDEKGKI